MNLKQLLPVLEHKEVKGDSDPLVKGITQDSRLVQGGFVFVCICGYQQDGHEYIEEALNRGAVAVVVEKDISARDFSSLKDSLIVVRVQDSREALALLSSTFYQNPSQKMRIIGITGTNGKTTTTYLVASILEASGFSVGLINTLTCRIKGEEVPAVRTTPESVDLQKALARMVEQGCQYAVIEVSSHSLVLKRVLGCEFDVGVWTNMTPDHLDFHRTFPEYRQAKQRLFLSLEEGRKSGKAAVLNMDDPSYSLMEKSTAAPIFSFGLQKKKAHIRAEKIIAGRQGMNFEVQGPFGHIKIQTDLDGIYNVSNILAAIGVGLAEKVDIDKIQLGIQRVSHIPGRFETITCGQDFWVVVDFAHTPDALNRLLETSRQLQPRRIITVFGCGGDRDTMKRFPMGRIAATLSDHIIITSDNARSENPMDIARQIEEGVCSVRRNERSKDEREIGQKYEIILDRYKAIERAIFMAETEDMVVIAGKGHEQYQKIGPRRIPFDDRQVVRKILHNRKPACYKEVI